jgi:hypothetical protein
MRRKKVQYLVIPGKGGWAVGDGRMKGINPSDVKGMPTKEVIRMLNSKMGSKMDSKMKGKM